MKNNERIKKKSRRTACLHVRATPEDLARWASAARAAGGRRGRSEWVRAQLDAAADEAGVG